MQFIGITNFLRIEKRAIVESNFFFIDVQEHMRIAHARSFATQ